jgi:cell wall-associated NlpC family hydrolase
VWKKEQFLHRSILTGLFVCILSAGSSAAAFAAEPGDQGAPAVATTTVTSATDTAAPTAGADLAMWNAGPAPADDPDAAAAKAVKLSRLAHVQKFASGIAARTAAMASNLTRNAMRFLGVRYSFGGTSTYGFDCSGYVQHVFAMMGVHLPRMADEQYYAGKSFAGDPKPGDLVFFHTYAPGVSHVGISLGGDKFVHASSSHGVMISSLHDTYWNVRYLGAKRVVN